MQKQTTFIVSSLGFLCLSGTVATAMMAVTAPTAAEQERLQAVQEEAFEVGRQEKEGLENFKPAYLQTQDWFKL